MKVLVTGADGYIGAVLCPKLLKRGYSVTGIDTCYFRENILGEASQTNHIVVKDIRSITKEDLKGFSAVIHLAALSNDALGEIDPRLTENINFEASVRLARLAKAAGVSRFIFSSSCSVYGISDRELVDELSKPNPQTSYAKAKLATEQALKELGDEDFCVCLLRNSTVYGFSPKFRSDLVVNNFITQAHLFNLIKIMSDGTPWRPLIDVRDLADVFIAFLSVNTKKVNNVIFNIGFQENNVQVKDIASIVTSELEGVNLQYTHEHGKDTRSYRVNFTRFQNVFPKLKQQWPLHKSVRDMYTVMQKYAGRTENLLEKYNRLHNLKKYIKEKKVTIIQL